MRSGNFILCYDISDDRERTRTERVVERFGVRVQKSVFWCPLESRQQREALEAALRKLNIQSGFVLLAPTTIWGEACHFGGGDAPAIDEGALLAQ